MRFGGRESNRGRAPRSWLSRLVRLGVVASAAILVIIVAATAIVGRAGSGRIYIDADELPDAQVAIVPGALVFASGAPSSMLANRVDAAVDLYAQGTVSHLLVSGDNSEARYNEPVAMRDRAIDQQVPAQDITLDYAGLDTWDTCRRAREQFGVSSAIVVTQKLYASRTAALCEAAGIDVAVLALDPPPLRTSTRWMGRAREPLAKVKAVADLVRTPSAKFGGPFIGLVGSVGMPAGGHPPDWDWQANAPSP